MACNQPIGSSYGVVVVEDELLVVVALELLPIGVVVLLAGWPMVPVLPPCIICSEIGS